MKKTEAEKAPKGKRQHLIRFRMNDTENFVIRNKAERAGMHPGGYIRQMAIYGELKERLTEEERQAIRQLIGMSNDLNKLVEYARGDNLLSALLHFERYRNRFDQIFNQFIYDK